MRCLDGFTRLLRMMQRLAENHEVNTVWFNGRILQIAKTKLQVLQSVFLRLAGAEFNHLLRIVHGDYFFAAPRQKLAQQTFARSQVCHRDGRKYAQQQMAERLPGTPRTVTAIEASRDLIEINLLLLF